MAKVVQEGKAKYIGVCNVTANQLRRAASVHPIAAVQNEYSLWTRDIELTLLPTQRLKNSASASSLGRPLAAASSRGKLARSKLMTSAIGTHAIEGNLKSNVDRFALLHAFAAEKGVTPVQLALARLLHQGDDIVPTPGTRDPKHLDDNLAAVSVTLSEKELKRIDELAPAGLAAGRSLLEVWGCTLEPGDC